MNTINTISYFLNAVFLILIVYTFTENPIKKYREKKQQNAYKQAVAENKKKKLIPFRYQNGKIEIWAKNSKEADKQYAELLIKIHQE